MIFVFNDDASIRRDITHCFEDADFLVQDSISPGHLWRDFPSYSKNGFLKMLYNEAELVISDWEMGDYKIGPLKMAKFFFHYHFVGDRLLSEAPQVCFYSSYETAPNPKVYELPNIKWFNSKVVTIPKLFEVSKYLVVPQNSK